VPHLRSGRWLTGNLSCGGRHYTSAENRLKPSTAETAAKLRSRLWRTVGESAIKQIPSAKTPLRPIMNDTPKESQPHTRSVTFYEESFALAGELPAIGEAAPNRRWPYRDRGSAGRPGWAEARRTIAAMRCLPWAQSPITFRLRSAKIASAVSRRRAGERAAYACGSAVD